MGRVRENGFTRASTEIYATLKNLMIRRGYGTVKDFIRRVKYPLNYQPLRTRVAKPLNFKLDEIFMFASSLQMPAEDFGEMCKNAYAEFKKV